jgi:hypothetical protein
MGIQRFGGWCPPYAGATEIRTCRLALSAAKPNGLWEWLSMSLGFSRNKSGINPTYEAA